ncbi:carbonate dehydratase [Dissulfurimicrobium hydrothermale]|uniref:carbonate dehydratase n=1 Tax=Dissulfurimicrobium hydrothermale TaxID=1750598 RepID=UPI001ED9FC73|nr:carbonate dehydratase [Dissulfurimicrobium hydrothermale]UKL13334.1 carbonate dehydratase [Dissulfurimicrobium hydrothermale]
MTLKCLFDNNRAWADGIKKEDPAFFERLSKQQSPKYLWIGCSDSRVPANQIVGMPPGELFVHRNIANIVVQSDINCMAVIQYAVEVLSVQHIIVCGHYGCGGVKTAMDMEEIESYGLINNWLGHVSEVYRRYMKEINAIFDAAQRLDRLCEFNVIEQVHNVCRTGFVRNAWRKGRDLYVHGWIYSIRDGILKDLDVSVNRI